MNDFVMMTVDDFNKIVDDTARLKYENILSRKPYTTKEAREILGISKTKFYELVKDSKTEIRKMGNSRYSRKSVEKEKERLFKKYN